MSSLVSGTLDSDYVYISGLPTSTVSVQLNATWKDTAVYATESIKSFNSGATFTYSVTYSPDSVASVSFSGNTLTVTAKAYGTARVVVYAIDGRAEVQRAKYTLPCPCRMIPSL